MSDQAIKDHLDRERERGKRYAVVTLHHGPSSVASAACVAEDGGWRTVSVWRGEANVTYVLVRWAG